MINNDYNQEELKEKCIKVLKSCNHIQAEYGLRYIRLAQPHLTKSQFLVVWDVWMDINPWRNTFSIVDTWG